MFLKKTNILKVKNIFFLLMFVLPFSSSYGVENFNYFNYIEKLNSFSSSFTQHTYNEKGSLVKESNGVLLYKKKSKYILEYLSHNKIKFISDGALVTTLDIDLDQAIIQSTNNKAQNNFFEIMTNKDVINKKFVLKSYLYNDDNHVKFTPKNKELENNIFLLIIKDSKIKKITFMNDFDQSVTMVFSDFKVNLGVLDSSFKIDIPENFDVIIDK